jgi:endonuclease-8
MPLGVVFGQILTMDDQVADGLAEVAEGSAAAHEATFTGARLGEHFERRFYLYKRTGEPCHTCGSKIRTRLVAGRNLFWCGRCQRRR